MFKNIKLKKALIGAGLGVLGACAVAGGTWLTIDHVINRDNDSYQPSKPLIDGKINDSNNVEMPKNITFTRFSQVASSNNTLTVSCNVLPTYAVNKKLTWSLQWADGGNHGTVTDFVKMTVGSDTHSVTIQA